MAGKLVLQVGVPVPSIFSEIGLHLVTGPSVVRGTRAGQVGHPVAGLRAEHHVLSVVSELELLVKPLRIGDRQELERVHVLCHGAEHVVTLPVVDSVAQRAASLRARYALKLADAIIVATAIEAGCDGMIGNDRLCAQGVREIPYLYLDALAGAGQG